MDELSAVSGIDLLYGLQKITIMVSCLILSVNNQFKGIDHPAESLRECSTFELSWGGMTMILIILVSNVVHI